MSAEPALRPRPEFSAGIVLALVLVGIVAFAGMAVLGAFAPDLRSGSDGRAHALSKSAIGYAGAPILMKGLGVPLVVSRTRPSKPSGSVVILTPGEDITLQKLKAYPKGVLTLIVLPKWDVTADPIRQGFVRKAGVKANDKAVQALFAAYAKTSRVEHRAGRSRPVLRGAGGPFRPDLTLKLGQIDRLQTLSGEGWIPALADEQGRAVLAISRKTPSIWVLAEPDLLNNQGLASRDNARAAMLILQVARGGDRPLLFDVTLNGFERGRGLLKTLLQPPWLAATLCGVAAALLMGLHALARFGQPRRTGRAFALGTRALVDNSAGLVRMARREHELAPAYAALVRTAIGKASGGHDEAWLEELARRRGAASPGELAAEAEQAKSREDLLQVARKLWNWKSEMTRERR